MSTYRSGARLLCGLGEVGDLRLDDIDGRLRNLAAARYWHRTKEITSMKTPFASFLCAGIGALTLGLAVTPSAADEAHTYHRNEAQLRATLAARRHAVTSQASLSAKKASNVSANTTVSASSLAGGFVNPDRAYPPSCLADGLSSSSASADPNAQQLLLTAPIYDSTTGDYDLTETETYTLWRVPCSGGTSAVLLQIDRPSAADGNADQFPVFPNLYTGSNGNPLLVRAPNDANTVYSDNAPGSPVVYSNIYVLEYYPGTSSADASSQNGNYNQAFTLNIDTLFDDSNNNRIIGTINLPAYSANSFNNYPSSTNPLEISGYVSGPWYDPTHSGEGLLIQVYDNGDQATRTFAATWYTFDGLGIPFWLYAQAVLPIQGTAAGVTNGYQVINAPVKYVTGGGFAGNFTPPVTSNTWGTMSFSFQDCNTLNFSYNGATGSSLTSGPTGSGSKQWTRLANTSGLVCQ
jgi:hypothetical protein